MTVVQLIAETILYGFDVYINSKLVYAGIISLEGVDKILKRDEYENETN